jgi:hypothetical protein
MEEIQSFCTDNSEYAEFDAVNRGYRGDIYIKIGKEYFNLHVYDPVRLSQDFNHEIEEYGFFSSEPNIVIVPEVNSWEIVQLAKYLFKSKYFLRIKPTSADEIKKLNLMHLL